MSWADAVDLSNEKPWRAGFASVDEPMGTFMSWAEAVDLTKEKPWRAGFTSADEWRRLLTAQMRSRAGRPCQWGDRPSLFMMM